MKISRLKKLAGVFLALTVTATTLFAQGRGFRNRVNVYSNVNAGVMSCIDQISGLSEKQVSEITTLEEQQQNVMASLRLQRRSTPYLDEKEQIRKQMDATVENHRNEVMALLSSEQKEQYAKILSQGTLHKYQNPYGRGIYGRRGSGVRQGAFYGNYRNPPGGYYRRGLGRGANTGYYGRGVRNNSWGSRSRRFSNY